MSLITLLSFILLINIIFALPSSRGVKRITNDQDEDWTESPMLPECIHPDSACGYVQLNSMGISTESFCRCRNFASCPLQWNPYDGRTIMHGTDQYKFCGKAPSVQKCLKEEIVLTVYLEMLGEPSKKLISDYRLHCQCPSNHIFVLNDMKFPTLPNGADVVATSYKCKSSEVCGAQEPCMTIAETERSTIFKRLCTCPMDTFCPNDIRLAYSRHQWDKGASFTMHCI